MEIRKQKDRHKEDLRQRILDAAKTLFMKHGYEATSIRKIAAEIKFSPTTIYLYYRDKNDILYALHQEGFRMLGISFAALAQVEHPFERLKAMGRTYLQFALENSDFYELMFIMKEPLLWLDEKSCTSADWEEGVKVFDFLQNTILDCQNHNYFAGQNPKLFSLFVWSTVHGLCSLTLHGHFEHVVKENDFDADANSVLKSSFENFLNILEKIK